jgi:hypothetical protein
VSISAEMPPANTLSAAARAVSLTVAIADGRHR